MCLTRQPACQVVTFNPVVEISPLDMTAEAEVDKIHLRRRQNSNASYPEAAAMSLPQHQPIASTSSGLQALHMPLMTPRTPRSAYEIAGEEMEMKRFTVDSDYANGYVDADDDKDEVDGLLGTRSRKTKKRPRLSSKDRHAIALLIVLCVCDVIVKILI